MTKRFGQVDWIVEVVSLATAMNVRGVEGELRIEPFLGTIPSDPVALASIRDRLKPRREKGKHSATVMGDDF